MSTNEEEQQKIKETVKWIICFLLSVLALFILVLAGIFLLNFSWGVLALAFGMSLLFLSIYMSFFKIILTRKFDMINPGGEDLQRITLILTVSGILIIFLALLNLMNVIPWQ